jgi:hypothetical protein
MVAVIVLFLELLHEFLRDLAILGHLKLDLSLQRAIACRLHVEFRAKRLLFLTQAIPIFVALQMRKVLAPSRLVKLGGTTQGTCTEKVLLIPCVTECLFKLLELLLLYLLLGC